MALIDPTSVTSKQFISFFSPKSISPWIFRWQNGVFQAGWLHLAVWHIRGSSFQFLGEVGHADSTVDKYGCSLLPGLTVKSINRQGWCWNSCLEKGAETLSTADSGPTQSVKTISAIHNVAVITTISRGVYRRNYIGTLFCSIAAQHVLSYLNHS